MRKKQFSFAAIAVALLACSQQPREEQDRAALQRLREDFVTYVNAGDAASLATLLDPDVVLIPQSVPEVSGIEACEEHYREMFEYWRFHLGATAAELVVLGDIAIDRGTTESVIVKKETGKTYTSKGKYLMISRRQPDGGWKVWRDIANYSER